jgi:hypothetical protein
MVVHKITDHAADLRVDLVDIFGGVIELNVEPIQFR